jgi:hypothetical protein
MRSFIICTLAVYNYNAQEQKDEMGRACRTNGREEEYI